MMKLPSDFLVNYRFCAVSKKLVDASFNYSRQYLAIASGDLDWPTFSNLLLVFNSDNTVII